MRSLFHVTLIVALTTPTFAQEQPAQEPAKPGDIAAEPTPEERFRESVTNYNKHLVELAQRHLSFRPGKRAAEFRAIGRRAAANEPNMPLLYLWKLELGQIGLLTGNSLRDNAKNKFEVMQVIDDYNMLIASQRNATTVDPLNVVETTKERWVWVSGVPTKGIVDDSVVKLEQVFEVVDTKRYAAAIGTNTVFVIQPFEIQSPDKLLAVLKVEPKKPMPKPIEPAKPMYGEREWTSADGKFTVEATFIESEDGKVKLRLADKREIEVDVESLSEEDQAYLGEIEEQ